MYIFGKNVAKEKINSNEVIDKVFLSEKFKDRGIDYVAAVESRGFIFGAPLAYINKKSFVPVRKKGKLPRATVERSYDLEYGTATIEIHKDAIKPGDRVVIIDDLLATGGTVEAAIKLVEMLGGKVVGCCFLIELEELKGREKLKDFDVFSLLKY